MNINNFLEKCFQELLETKVSSWGNFFAFYWCFANTDVAIFKKQKQNKGKA